MFCLSLVNQVSLLAAKWMMPRFHEMWCSANSYSAGYLAMSICSLADTQLCNFVKINADTKSSEGLRRPSCTLCIAVLKQYTERMVTRAERKEGTAEQSCLLKSAAGHTDALEPTAHHAKSKSEKEILGTFFNCNQTKTSHLLPSGLGS